MRPLIVTAETPAGYASGDPWSPTLDGILAYAVTRERLGPDMGTNLDLRPVEGLPLAVEEHGGQWWYAAGVPEAEPIRQYDRHLHRRFDVLDAERLVPGVRKVQTAMGPYKAMRKPRHVTVTGTVRWQAIGEAAEVRRLLAGIPSIGSGWSRGFGRVVRWTVEEVEAVTIRRPVPVAWGEERGITGARMIAALRPPAHLSENRVMCVMPEAEDPFLAAVDALSRAAA